MVSILVILSIIKCFAMLEATGTPYRLQVNELERKMIVIKVM
ncbi:hypothetical protein [Bacillus sp. FSL R12-0069]